MIFQPNLVLHIAQPDAANISLYEHEMPSVALYLGPLKQSITTSATSSVFLAHYSRDGEPFSGPVEKLTFSQLGSSEIPNLGAYAQTCKTVEFTGYISKPSNIMNVIKQLPNVRKVSIFIDAAKQHTWMSKKEQKDVTETPVCAKVKYFYIGMEFEYFHNFYCDCNGDQSQCTLPGRCPQRVYNYLELHVESILKCATKSFPNMKRLVARLPENDAIESALQLAINTCHRLGEGAESGRETNSTAKVLAKLLTLNYAGYLRDIPSWCIPNMNSENRIMSRPLPTLNIPDIRPDNAAQPQLPLILEEEA